jgi:endonuclease III
MPDDLGPSDLDIDPARSPEQRYRWFLASLLLGRNIRQTQAANTYRALIAHGMTSPERFADLQREQLRAVLDEGGYDRFDFIMTDELHGVMAGVRQDWGSVNHLITSAKDRGEAHDRLLAYKGIGETTARIFLDAVPADLYGTA